MLANLDITNAIKIQRSMSHAACAADMSDISNHVGCSGEDYFSKMG